MMRLPRDEYKVVMRCLAAYHASFSVFSKDISLAYSILVYALETLSANFDEYTTSWSDYDQNIRNKLDTLFENVEDSVAEEIRNVLISNEHLKLSRRFAQFVLKYLDDDYYNAIDKRQGTEDEISQAIVKTYMFRSKYAHELKPINKQLMNARNSIESEIIEAHHEVFFTYSGLLRLTRTVIKNFVKSRKDLEREDYEWYDDLPGMLTVELPPYLWLGKSKDLNFKFIGTNFEALLYCIELEHQVPEMNELVENYVHNMLSICEKDRDIAYTLSWIYVNRIQGLDQSYIEKINLMLKRYSSITSNCSIAIIIGQSYGMPTGDFVLEDVISVINNYNKNKFKKNRIKIPNSIENRIYNAIAESYEGKDEESSIYWYRKLYRNSVNDIELQNETVKKLKQRIHHKQEGV